MSTAIGKFARTTALAAGLVSMAFFSASSANALTTINIGAQTGGTFNYGDLDIAADDEIKLEGTVKGTGTLTFNTYVSSSYSSAVAAINVLLARVKGSTGTVTGSWGGSPLTFTLTAGTWAADGSVSLAGVGPTFGKLLVVNYIGFTKTGSLSASLSAVPVPGAAMLLFSGLGGLGFLARRRKAKTA